MNNTKTLKNSFNAPESGNVLFLILIAVALFAALSYAVTQSTRSGGEGASNETALINSAQITQYPSTVKTGILRMVIKGADYQQFEFNPPADFADCTAANVNCVFHPDGGGATYVDGPSNIMANGVAGTWHFNMNFEIADVGTSTTGDDEGNEVIAFLPGINESLCQRINKEFAITGDTVSSGDISAEYLEDMDETYTLPGGETILGDSSTSTDGLAGQSFGCFRNGAAGDFVYYHVLLEK